MSIVSAHSRSLLVPTQCHVIPTKRVVEGATWQQLMELRIDVVDDTRKVISQPSFPDDLLACWLGTEGTTTHV